MASGGLLFEEGENEADTRLQAAHHQLLASALTVDIGHKINPEFKIGCMLLYPLTYAYTCRPEDQIEARNAMLKTYYFGDVQTRGYYSNTCKAYAKSIGGKFEQEQGDDEILRLPAAWAFQGLVSKGCGNAVPPAVHLSGTATRKANTSSS